jgi:hypothetical protein
MLATQSSDPTNVLSSLAVAKLEHFIRRPEQVTMQVGAECYFIAQAENLVTAWIEELEHSLDSSAANRLLYRMARRLAALDAAQLAADTEPELSCGERLAPHGLTLVSGGAGCSGVTQLRILPDSAAASLREFFLHFVHPGTFESEVARRSNGRRAAFNCAFTAGYSAGWCSEALQAELHAKELRCVGRGDAACEFVLGSMEMLASRSAPASMPAAR